MRVVKAAVDIRMGLEPREGACNLVDPAEAEPLVRWAVLLVRVSVSVSSLEDVFLENGEE